MNKKKLFISASVLSGLFIIASIFLIVKKSKIEKQLNHKALCISAAEDIDLVAFSLISSIESSNALGYQKTKAAIQNIILQSNQYAELSSIANALSKQEIASENNSKEERELKKTLISVKGTCARVIEECRNEIDAASEKLDFYWRITYILIFVACSITIILTIISYYTEKTSNELGSEKARTERLLNKSIDNIITCDMEGIIEEFNYAAERCFGYKSAEVIGKHISIICGEQGDEVSEYLIEKGAFSGEVINRKKDGSLLVCHLSANLIYDDDGNPIGSMGVSRDITEDKVKKQQYTNIVENASHVIYTMSSFGICDFVNHTVSKVFGYKTHDVMRKRLIDFVYENDMDKVYRFYQRQLVSKKEETYFEFRIKRKDGTIIWVGQIVKLIYSSIDRKNIIGFQGLLRDINEAKVAKIKLEKSEIRYCELFNNSTDLIHSIRPSGKLIYVNNSWENTLKYDDKEIKKLNILEIIHPDHKEYFSDLLREIISSDYQENRTVSYNVLSKDNKTYILEGEMVPSFRNGKLISIQSFLRNVTQEKKAAEIIRKQNEELADSIRYAQNIQKATLPTGTELNNVLEDYFIFFKPRDLLSGDFYVLEKVSNSENQEIIAFAVGDCTGHGIPGGMLSFLCNGLLKESLHELKEFLPSACLEFVRNKLMTLFRSNEEHHIPDGMEAALCLYDQKNKVLFFSGANLNLTLIRNGDLLEYKGTKQHIGYNHKKSAFVNERIKLRSGDCVYLQSDGFKDQFGGISNKKYLAKRLKSKLIDIYHLPMSLQKTILEEEFNSWKGDFEQTDDVTLFGVKV